MLIHNPDTNHLRAVEEWLKVEQRDCGHSFYCNWDIISAAFEDGRMMVETEGDAPVSFITFSSGRRVREGIIAVTAPTWRGRGIGARMMNGVHSHLHGAGTWVLHVQCCPPTSEKFWRRQRYVDYPAGHSKARPSDVHLYHSRSSPQPGKAKASCVDIWFRDTFGPAASPPDASFSIEHDLAFPVERDWHARIFDSNGNPKEDKIKRLVQPDGIEGRFLVAESTDWVV